MAHPVLERHCHAEEHAATGDRDVKTYARTAGDGGDKRGDGNEDEVQCITYAVRAVGSVQPPLLYARCTGHMSKKDMRPTQ